MEEEGENDQTKQCYIIDSGIPLCDNTIVKEGSFVFVLLTKTDEMRVIFLYEMHGVGAVPSTP